MLCWGALSQSITIQGLAKSQGCFCFCFIFIVARQEGYTLYLFVARLIRVYEGYNTWQDVHPRLRFTNTTYTCRPTDPAPPHGKTCTVTRCLSVVDWWDPYKIIHFERGQHFVVGCRTMCLINFLLLVSNVLHSLRLWIQNERVTLFTKRMSSVPQGWHL